LLEPLGVEVSPDLAEALYTAIVTDTGRFQYQNTTPHTLRLAADLVEAGADSHKVFQGVYESVQFAKLKLLARALERAGGPVLGAVVLGATPPPAAGARPPTLRRGRVERIRPDTPTELGSEADGVRR